MLRSLFSGASGLRRHQSRLDAIGSNVANVNTPGLAEGRGAFNDGFAQLLQAPGRPAGDQGGMEPLRVGRRLPSGSVERVLTQVIVEATGLGADLAIDGDSLFIVRRGDHCFYTRSGHFQLDADGRLVSPTNGSVLQGRLAVGGTLVDGVQDIRLPLGQPAVATPTHPVARAVRRAGDLDAVAPVPLVPATNPSTTRRTHAAVDPRGATNAGGTTGAFALDFVTDDVIVVAPGTTVAPTPTDAVQVATGTSADRLSCHATSGSVRLRCPHDDTARTLESFSIDRTGTITGLFTNGTAEPLSQIALADFGNVGGLLRVGDDVYAASADSGRAVVGYARARSES